MAHCLSPGSIGTAWESIKNVQEKSKDFYWSKLKKELQNFDLKGMQFL